MARPKFFRDPVHGQIRYDAVDIDGAPPKDRALAAWVVRKIIDTPEFQRLRHIRQNGLANLVFHGAEHSRFAHSMGAAYLAREMLERVELNKDDRQPDDLRAAVCVAALVHDIGHGPFSHAIEEACRTAGIVFDHEHLTTRFIVEETGVNAVLRAVDDGLPLKVAAFIDKTLRKQDHWTYRLVSSQLDADRLDYMRRDARGAGLQGYDFDLPRLLDCLEHLDGRRIAVDRRAIAAVELYLVALDKLYSSVYYHHAIRAATVLLGAVMQRAVDLFRGGDAGVLSPGPANGPLRALFERGNEVPIAQYAQFAEFHVWSAIDLWRGHRDPVLADLSARLLSRHLPKTIEFDALAWGAGQALIDRARSLTLKKLRFLNAETVAYYVRVDEPTRTSYKTYNWRAEAADESIWMVGGRQEPRAIENEGVGSVVAALREKRYFHRLVFPPEIRSELMA